MDINCSLFQTFQSAEIYHPVYWLRKGQYNRTITVRFPAGVWDFFFFNPFRSYFGNRTTLWFSCSRRFSWSLTLSNPIFLPPAYYPALIYFGRERGWWVTCNYPLVLKANNTTRKSTTCVICWLKSVLHKEKRRKHSSDIMIFLFPTLFLM
jgi:hypothetical protein